MSTRSTTHFIDSGCTNPATNKPYLAAIVYRHSDGYPEGAGKDIFSFLRKCNELSDSRLNDSHFLAAKYVVFLADMFNYSWERAKSGPKKGEYVQRRKKSKLDFLSVGVMMQDPGDIEYRYVIDCGKINKKTGLPEVKCYSVSVGDDGEDESCVETAIPGETTVPKKSKTAAETWINQIQVVSRTDSSKTYTLEQNLETLVWRCSCPGFKFRKTCRHLHALPFNRGLVA